MISSDSDENSYRSPQNSTQADFTVAARRERAFSWKRVFKFLGCFLSALWLFMLHVSTANSGGFTHTACHGKVIITIGTIVAIFPMFFLRGRLLYALTLPFLCIAAWTLWRCWALWGWL